MKELRSLITLAQKQFVARFAAALVDGALPLAVYARFLQMEHYLTRDVQQRFYQCAGAQVMQAYPAVRDYLVAFANQEAPHHQDALDDLESIGGVLGSEPLDVALYHSFWKQWPSSRPFFRLGSTCIVENIAGGDAAAAIMPVIAALRSQGYGVKFARDHVHVELQHGDGILEVLERAGLSDSEQADLVAGARIGAVLYLRMIKWCLQPDELDAYALDLPAYAVSYPATHAA